jgi:hypothetical protein
VITPELHRVATFIIVTFLAYSERSLRWLRHHGTVPTGPGFGGLSPPRARIWSLFSRS